MAGQACKFCARSGSNMGKHDGENAALLRDEGDVARRRVDADAFRLRQSRG
jgi:hypothetical protein